jgi:hypothetical protein
MPTPTALVHSQSFPTHNFSLFNPADRVAQLLSDALGHRMCPGESSRGCNKAGDNTVMFKFTGREVLNSALGRIPMLINESREPSRSATLAAMCTAVTETNTRAEAAPGERWGWKSPRSLYYGAFYEQALQGQYKLVHVLRDGRDVATGDNQMQYSSLCGGLNGTNGKATPCSKINEGAAHHRDALRFWAQMNREVFEFGTKVLGPDRCVAFSLDGNPPRGQSFHLSPAPSIHHSILVAYRQS